MNRKYFMTPAMRPKGSVIVGQEYRVVDGDTGSCESIVSVEGCSKNENNDGWMQLTVTKVGEKRSTSTYACISRQQAEALRDLLNAAFGGSSRVARTIEGSHRIAQTTEVK